jgi:hypothetical protein
MDSARPAAHAAAHATTHAAWTGSAGPTLPSGRQPLKVVWPLALGALALLIRHALVGAMRRNVPVLAASVAHVLRAFVQVVLRATLHLAHTYEAGGRRYGVRPLDAVYFLAAHPTLTRLILA